MKINYITKKNSHSGYKNIRISLPNTYIVAFMLSGLLTNQFVFSQTINYNHRSIENPFYWSKKKPYTDYWQQDVHYTIDAKLVDTLNRIDVSKYKLVYWNNSPDTLTELYFHLYQNAFMPGSYMENLYLNNGIKVTFGEYEKQGLGTVFENLTVDKQSVKIKLDNTILQITLNNPLLPKDSLVVEMSFKTYFDKGSLRRRMKYFEEFGSKHFDAVHWYPSICVYDHKFKWTTDQDLDKEYYADFGTFDVNISVPNHYIVEATGELTNELEVLPKELRNKIDLNNFLTKPDTISKPIVADGSYKTWKYHAINVHNFAFTTDPKYRIREQYWKGIKVVTLAMEQNAYRWQGSGNFAEQITKIYSTDFGMYAWPKIVVADAKDGMEYPMLTLDNGTYPGHQGLLAHEMGHMWFYGMIGSNETYRAFMDEGFTQFLTVWSLDKINGESINYKEFIKKDSKQKWMLKHLNPSENRYERLYYPYIKWILEGYDHALNTHSSDFNGATRHGGGYGLVYYKTGVMLYNLRYVLGEEKFLEAMKYYFDTWKMKHPYPEDFRKTMIHFSKTDLNWFFDEWLETTKYIDYSVEKVRAGQHKGEYEILFRRLGTMQMPIDFSIKTQSGKTYSYHIPNTWYQKETKDSILEKWYGWDKLQETYTAKIFLNEEVTNIFIDSSHYLADVNLANNQWKKKYRFQFDHRVKNTPNWYQTENFWRPDIFYYAQDGLKLGAHIEGSYFKMLNRYSITANYNTKLLKQDTDEPIINKSHLFSIDTRLDQNLRKIWRGLESQEQVVVDAGIFKTQLGFSKRFKERDLQAEKSSYLSIYHQTFTLLDKDYTNYFLMQNSYPPTLWNNNFNINFARAYNYSIGSGKMDVTCRTPGFKSDYNYGYLELQNVNRTTLGKLKLNTRFFGRLGYGNTPLESSLYAYGANPEELYKRRISRAEGILNQDLVSTSNGFLKYHSAGGLNLRAFSGILIQNGSKNYRLSTSGASINAELDFGGFIKTKGNLSNYLSIAPLVFADAGSLVSNTKNQKILADAGIGVEFQIKFYYLDIKPLIIRTELPLYISTNQNYSMNTLIIGIGKSF